MKVRGSFVYKGLLKRVFDIVLSLLFLPTFALLYVTIGLMIKIEDHGPVFYKAKRLGKNGSVFIMYKFRSMNINAPDIRNRDGSTYNSEEDLRLTKIGKFIRKTSLDEIPQILNVLKGDMSFIGPRPDLPEALELYNEVEIRKTFIRPGVTGYSQAYYRNSIELFDKFKNDVYYVDHISFWLDMKIVIKTIVILFQRKNVFTKGKELLDQKIVNN